VCVGLCLSILSFILLVHFVLTLFLSISDVAFLFPLASCSVLWRMVFSLLCSVPLLLVYDFYLFLHYTSAEMSILSAPSLSQLIVPCVVTSVLFLAVFYIYFIFCDVLRLCVSFPLVCSR